MSRTSRLLAGWAAALLVAAVFARLGHWQAGRAVDKERMLAEARAVLDVRRAKPAATAFDASRARSLDWTEARGVFAPIAPLLLDNQQRDGRVGVRVYRLFRFSDGGDGLVDLGWMPLPGDRTLPVIAPVPASRSPDGRWTLRGLLAPPPSAGLALGPPMARQGEGGASAWLATRIDLGAVHAALGTPGRPLAPRILRLDPALPIGYPRDLALLANTLPPDKHRGYALQWFGLAITVLAIALVLTFRTLRR